MAYAILGCLDAALGGDDRYMTIAEDLAARSARSMADGRPDWPWPDDTVTYDDEPRTLFVAQCDAGMLQIDAARNLRITDGEGTVVESHGDDDWLTTEVTAFADAIDDPASASPNITDGYRALRSALAAEQSTQGGRWVVPDR